MGMGQKIIVILQSIWSVVMVFVTVNLDTRLVEMGPNAWKLLDTDWNHPARKVFSAGKVYWVDWRSVILEQINVAVMKVKLCPLFITEEGIDC